MSAANDRRDHLDASAVGETLLDVLRKRDRNLSLAIRVAAPGQVRTYNAATQRADVVLGFRPVREGELRDEPEAPIVIPGVRVAWPRASGGAAYLTLPLQPGDTGLLVFADRALDRWYAQGGAVDPGDARAHSLADAVFYPGLPADSDTITPAPDPVAPVIEGPQIKIGRNATAPTGQIALAQALHTYITALITAGAPAPSGDGGAALKSTMLAYLAANPFTAFATTKALAE